MQLVAPVPARSRVANSWQGYGDHNRGAVEGPIGEGQTIRWSGFGLRAGDRLPPFTYRLSPMAGENGAALFRQTTVRPEVSYAAPAAGQQSGAQAAPPVLRPQWPVGRQWTATHR